MQRSRMTEERLVGLAPMHIHSEIDINILNKPVIYMSVNIKPECFNHSFCISKCIDNCMYFWCNCDMINCHLHAKGVYSPPP